MNTLSLAQVPRGATIEYEGETWTVHDVRRHAMTCVDETVWLLLEGWKGDPPKLHLDTPIIIVASFA